MKFDTAITIFVVCCLIILPIQLIMYGNSICVGGGCNDPLPLQNIIIFTTPFTIALGVLAPILNLIELLIKKYIDIESIRNNSKNFLIRLFLKDLTISFIVIISFNLIINYSDFLFGF